MAMPRDRASALAAVICEFPARKPAYITKWGCCTGDNNLSLSLFLMTLPPHLRDFVLLHELCHTVHHDHSPHFHALLDRLTGGNEKLLSRELRSHSIPAR